MATTLGFKDIIDLPEWRPLSPAPSNSTAGVSLASDLRNNFLRHPYIYQLASATVLNRYNMFNDDWNTLASPALGGTFAAGAGSLFVPSAGPYGTIAAGATTTTVVISTAFATAVGVNTLANRGDGVGQYIRIIGKSAGGSGKTEEREIIANTAGTTPTIEVDSAFTFTPANGDGYEILSGKLFLMSAGALAAGIFKSYCVATQTVASLTTTNLIATVATDMTWTSMDEAYIPYTRSPGEGFLIGTGTYDGGSKGCLTATASAAGTITGQASGGDASVLANEYRNFQIRIVEDTAIPTAVGQRRKITSHTAGASPVYTLVTNWTTTPSVNAKFVIELNNDILCWNGTTTVTYSYLAGYNADANWSTAAAAGGATQYANPSAAHAAGAMVLPSYGIVPDTGKYARHSFFYLMRGGAATVDLFDIAGGATGAWTAAIGVTGNTGFSPGAGSTSMYEAATFEGRYAYINPTGTQRFMRFDVKNRVLEPFAYMRYPQGTITAGDKLCLGLFVDGTTKLAFLYTVVHASTPFLQVALQR